MKHIVVVEDDAVNAVLFRKLLERRGGYQVTVTDSPDEVMSITRAGGIALVVMDVSLVDSWWEGKQVNGVDLCRLLKTDAQTIGVPIVLATAHAMRGDMERLLSDSGADDYVAKPIVDHDKFLEQIRRWVQSEAA